MVLELFEELQEGKLDRLAKLRELDSKISEYSIPLVRKRSNDPVGELGEQLEETQIREEKKPQIDDDGFMTVTKAVKKRE